MVFSYYPGCTLKTKAKQLDEYGRKSAEALGISLEELIDYNLNHLLYRQPNFKEYCSLVFPTIGSFHR